MNLDNFKDLNLGEKIILGGCAASILSLFLPWVELGFLSASGFQQQGYIMILFWLYPAVQAVKQQTPKKALSLGLPVVSLIFMFAMLNDKNASLFGTSINAAGSGMYLMIGSLIAILVGGFLNQR